MVAPTVMLAPAAVAYYTRNVVEGGAQGRRKPVTWLHLHKFGGTFMTKMARLQGETFPMDNINANWMPDFCSTPRGERVLCAARTGLESANANISWSAMERELDEGDFCKGALIGTMLREPLGALQSVLSHDRFDRMSILQTLRTCSEAVPAKHFMYRAPSNYASDAPRCLPPWDTYQHFDNFATRTLGGAYTEPPCAIGRSHLTAAMQQLRRMDVVMILEELNKHLPQLLDTFHWNITLVQPWRRVNRKPGEKSEHVQKFTLDEMSFLKQVNSFDIELYEFGLSLAQNMTRRAQQNTGVIGEDMSRPQADSGTTTGAMDALRTRVEHRLSLRRRMLVS
jgi:hypothetical protein